MKFLQKKFDIITIGSITLDTFVNLDGVKIIKQKNRELFEIPVGDKIKMTTKAKFIGGSSANSSVGFAKMGLKTACLGSVGADCHHDYILHQLAKQSVNTKFIQVQNNYPSSTSIIITNKDGRRTVLHEKSISNKITEIPKTKAIYCGHLSPNEEIILEKIYQLKQNNPRKIFGWNPGKTQFSQGFSKYKKFMSVCDCLILNVEEAEMFTNLTAKKVSIKSFKNKIIGNKNNLFKEIADLQKIADKFLATGMKSVIITDGRNGAQYFSREKQFLVPILESKKPVSTLGAGDSFSVGVLSALFYKKSPENMMFTGSLNSTSVVKYFGAQNGLLTWKEVCSEISKIKQFL